MVGQAELTPRLIDRAAHAGGWPTDRTPVNPIAVTSLGAEGSLAGTEGTPWRGGRGIVRMLTAICLLLLPSCGSDAPTPMELDPAALNILFIGNSLTYVNDLPGMVEALISSAGAGPVAVHSVAFGNYGLEDHWVSGEARTVIGRGGWDYVVMQQGPSASEGRPSLLEYSAKFAELIRAEGAVPALYMVWPSIMRPGDWDLVLDSYATAAAAVDGVFLPAGEAWRVAWETDPSLAFYGPDGFHPTVDGTYLAALVIVERLSGHSAVGLSHNLTTRLGVRVALPAETADVLQQAAAEAIARFAAPAPGR